MPDRSGSSELTSIFCSVAMWCRFTENQTFFSYCLDLSATPVNPQPIFSVKKSKINSVCPVCSHHDINLRYHPNFQNNWSRERPWNDLAAMSGGKVSAKKGHGSTAELESKSSSFANHSSHIDSDTTLCTRDSNASESAHRILSLHCQ